MFGANYLLSQLAYQGPMLLVCLVAVILSILYLGRAKTPALLTLAGAALWLVTAVVVTVLQGYVLQQRMLSGSSVAAGGQWLTVIGVAGSFLRAIALGLIVAAVFVGRAHSDSPRP